MKIRHSFASIFYALNNLVCKICNALVWLSYYIPRIIITIVIIWFIYSVIKDIIAGVRFEFWPMVVLGFAMYLVYLIASLISNVFCVILVVPFSFVASIFRFIADLADA